MAETVRRRSLTAALVRLEFTSPGGFQNLNQGVDASGLGIDIRTIARAQQIQTTDQMPYARIKQIGYATIVEDVPLFLESQGSLSTIETIGVTSLYKLGIIDFVSFVLSCERPPLDIAMFNVCQDVNQGVLTNNGGNQIDVLNNCKFTMVTRAVDVNGQLVMNQAAFYYIRPLSLATYNA